MADSPTAYVRAHREAFIEDLADLVAQPSISATGAGIEDCAALLRACCTEYGFDAVRVIETPGAPAVIARAFADAEGERPTVFLYGHYDVQPVDAAEWTTPPFEPTRRPGPDGADALFGRGVSDNKGQFFAHLCAVRALRATTGLPVDVVLLLDGEEESSSPNLEAVLAEHRDRLAADLVYTADAEIEPDGRPAVYLGIRGLLPVRLSVRAADRELHAGLYGGPVPEATRALVTTLASMWTPAGEVAIEGFDDAVRAPSPAERDALAAIPVDEAALRERFGLERFTLGSAESYLERLLFRPSLTVSGLQAGYAGDGYKSSIPASATAVLTAYLVPEQDPDDVYAALRRHVQAHTPAWADVEVTRLDGERRSNHPFATPLDSPFRAPIEAAIRDTWGEAPVVYPRIGGGGPQDLLAEYVSDHVFIVPYGNPDSGRHGPDENLTLAAFERGVLTSVAALGAVADTGPDGPA